MIRSFHSTLATLLTPVSIHRASLLFSTMCFSPLYFSPMPFYPTCFSASLHNAFLHNALLCAVLFSTMCFSSLYFSPMHVNRTIRLGGQFTLIHSMSAPGVNKLPVSLMDSALHNTAINSKLQYIRIKMVFLGQKWHPPTYVRSCPES